MCVCRLGFSVRDCDGILCILQWMVLLGLDGVLEWQGCQCRGAL